MACSQNGDMQERRQPQRGQLNHKGDNQKGDNANLCHKGVKREQYVIGMDEYPLFHNVL